MIHGWIFSNLDRKQFTDVEYDHDTRQFRGSILWPEGSLWHNSRDTFKWTLVITFSSDLHQTVALKETQFNRDGRVLKSLNDSDRLRLYGLCRD